MRCIFCKSISDDSRSKEHIVPESLGNTLYVLPPGVVCDGCNNYFARKVEKPFLESGAVLATRAYQAVPTKAGKLVGIKGMLSQGHPVTAYLPRGKMPVLDVHTDAGVRSILSSKQSVVYFPESQTPPRERTVSRFLAKMALEALAAKGLQAGLSVAYLVDEIQLDPIRTHARIGDPRTGTWPCSVRRIYDAEKSWTEPDGTVLQTVHEYDFLITDQSEWYFVAAIFGLELVINLAGPSIEGYERWLAKHGDVSPLYWGRNASGWQP